MHYASLAQAQDMLEVSAGRVSALIKNGQLEARYFDGQKMVSIQSVNDYMNSPRKAGRPRKNKTK